MFALRHDDGGRVVQCTHRNVSWRACDVVNVGFCLEVVAAVSPEALEQSCALAQRLRDITVPTASCLAHVTDGGGDPLSRLGDMR